MKPVALFSKHLGWLTIDQLGPVASEIGLEAVQLSVRPGGHIDPERAATDLPRAVRTLQLAGVAVPSVVTALTDPADDLTRRVVGA
ncbi:MAG: sugar phosphate isomerase/epimerase, partial [Spirochaetota bacterium]